MKIIFPIQRRAGFSLVELLAVLAIMAALATMVVPALNGTISGTRISMAAQNVVGEINFARVTAMARNMPVEVCFLDAGAASDTGQQGFRAIQSRILGADGSKNWISQISRLPDGIVLSANASHTTFLSSNPYSIETPSPDVTQGIAIRIYPSGLVAAIDQDGNPVPSLDPHFLTLGRDIQMHDAVLPSNFATIQINTRTSRATILQP